MNSTLSKLFGFFFPFMISVAFLASLTEQLTGGAEFKYFKNWLVSPCGFEAHINSTRQKK